MVCSLPQNYSSPIDYQYYLVVTLKCRCNQPGSTTTPPPKPRDPRNNNKKDPSPPKKKGEKKPQGPETEKRTPPPPQKKKTRLKKKTKKNKDQEKKKVKKKRELSLRILPRRKRLLTSLHRERLVRRGLQQQYLMRFSNLVKFMYARIIK